MHSACDSEVAWQDPFSTLFTRSIMSIIDNCICCCKRLRKMRLYSRVLLEICEASFTKNRDVPEKVSTYKSAPCMNE